MPSHSLYLIALGLLLSSLTARAQSDYRDPYFNLGFLGGVKSINSEGTNFEFIAIDQSVQQDIIRRSDRVRPMGYQALIGFSMAGGDYHGALHYEVEGSVGLGGITNFNLGFGVGYNLSTPGGRLILRPVVNVSYNRFRIGLADIEPQDFNGVSMDIGDETFDTTAHVSLYLRRESIELRPRLEVVFRLDENAQIHVWGGYALATPISAGRLSFTQPDDEGKRKASLPTDSGDFQWIAGVEDGERYPAFDPVGINFGVKLSLNFGGVSQAEFRRDHF